jgi:signal peptidase II
VPQRKGSPLLQEGARRPWANAVMNKPPTYRHLFLLLAVVGLAADQASKYLAFSRLRDAPGYEQVVIPGVFSLVAHHDHEGAPSVNRGALFGWMQGWGLKANTGFAVISLLAAIAIVVWVAQRSTATDFGLCLALGLILGGTLGNFYDRVKFGGVRDFLHWRAPEWPVFNIADCCLVIGAGLLLLQAFRAQPQGEQTEAVALKAQPVGAEK